MKCRDKVRITNKRLVNYNHTGYVVYVNGTKTCSVRMCNNFQTKVFKQNNLCVIEKAFNVGDTCYSKRFKGIVKIMTATNSFYVIMDMHGRQFYTDLQDIERIMCKFV